MGSRIHLDIRAFFRQGKFPSEDSGLLLLGPIKTPEYYGE
jgi:hypothetical protein